jgi:endonuclease/exonuclease/phosphatase family metal-dependent hydrolase
VRTVSHTRASITVLTWNVQGLAGIDAVRIARWLRDLQADVVLLQEVQARQLRAIAAAGGYGQHVWRFKHWPVKRPAEGHGILADRPIAVLRTQVLSRGEPRWGWRRRIALHASVDTRPAPTPVVCTHLGAGVPEGERVRQACAVMDAAIRSAVIGGDLNAHPGSPTLEAFAAEGWVDAWSRAHPELPEPMTNWHGGRNHPPNQRLDYLLIPPGWQVEHVSVPGDWQAIAALSDHAPVVARLRVGA